jgi:glycosyltransferase involved in cell wall biosynthesis
MARAVDLTVYSPHPRYLTPVSPRTRTWREIDTSYSPAGVETHYLNYPAIAGLSRSINGYICASWLAPLLAANRPEIILSYWIYPDGFAAVQLGRRLGIPVVVKAVGSDLNRPLDLVTKELTRRALHEADMILTVSQQLQQTVVQMGVREDKIRVVPNGCDAAVFHSGDRQCARRELGFESHTDLILYVGRLDLAKGLAELIEALSQIATDHPCKLALIGDGNAQAQLAALTRKLAVENRVVFPGVCTSAQVARWMRAANVLALPSYREGCPNVVIEALSTGLPVVGTYVGGIPEIVDSDCGVLVPPRDPTALAAALRAAMDRPWKPFEIARRMKRSWEQVAEETLEICQATLDVRTVHRAHTAPRLRCENETSTSR